MNNIGLDDIYNVMVKLKRQRPQLYYVLNELVQPGEIAYFRESGWLPEYVIVNPADEAKIKRKLSGHNLIPLSEYKVSPERMGSINKMKI